MLVIEPTGSACGALVKGIDLNKPISPTLMEKLVWALYQHRCLVIKNQELTKESYYQFASQWGELIQHVLDYLRMPDYPEMMAIGNTEEKDKDDAFFKAAELISTGEVIGTVLSRSETGPRALGNRSLICDGKKKMLKKT